MPYIPATGALSFDNDIEEMFEDQSPPAMSLSEYYRNGTNVQTAVTATNVVTSSVVTSGIPTSGQISFSDFRNQGFDTIAMSAIFDRNTSGLTFDTSFSWTVPSGVTEISAVCIGGGGGGGGNSSTSATAASAGGGGGAVYGHWAVTAGNTVTITVGSGGAGGTSAGADGSDGGDTIISYGGIDRLIAYGGEGGSTDTANNTAGGAGGMSGGAAKIAGGTGGRGGSSSTSTPHRSPGGGGAAGYGSGGGRGQDADGSPTAGSGGAGGGAGGLRTQTGSGWTFPNLRQAGGATGIYGQGDNGLTPISTSNTGVHQYPSVHGSNTASSGTVNLGPASGEGSITPPTSGTSNHPFFSGKAASPGGGGAGILQSTIGHGQKGGDGAVRIVWGTQGDGTIRRYPTYTAVSGD